MNARIYSPEDLKGGNPTGLSVPAFTWMSGSQQNANAEQAPVYGTQGIPSSSNRPGARENAASWRDSSGNLWLFGGYGVDAGGSMRTLNDLWEYSGGKWTWISGSQIGQSAGVYGTQGVPASTNTPGARGMSWGTQSASGSSGSLVNDRTNGATWVDGSGNLWLFGGMGYDSAGNSGELNDLWKFDTSTLQWTWVAGSDTVNASGVYGTQGVAAASNIPGARGGATAWKDHSGNFWLFGGYGCDSTGSCDNLNDLWKFDPTTSQWTWISGSNVVDANGAYGTQGTAAASNTPGARISALGAVDSSGSLWLFGGARSIQAYNDLWKFDITTSQWTWVSGSNSAFQDGSYGTQGVGSTSNSPGGRVAAAFWIDSHDLIWLFGGSVNGSTSGVFNDLWKFDPVSLEWTWVSGSSSKMGAAGYGTHGVAASSNTPGAEAGSAFWIDGSDRLWIFGGSTRDVFALNGTSGTYYGPFSNDLWSYDTVSGDWTWESGPSTDTVVGSYGTQGVASASNQPGARDNSTLWSDAAGNLWLFGGDAIDSKGFQSDENDLWKYNPTSGQWTWVAGSNSVHALGVYGTQGVASASTTPGARYGSMGWTDRSGRLWLFGGQGSGSTAYGSLNDLWQFDPSTSQWTWIAGTGTSSNVLGSYGTQGVGSTSNLPGARYNGATTMDASGVFWLFGGWGADSASIYKMLADLWKFDPTTLQWTWVSGPNIGNQSGIYGTQGVPSASNSPGGRESASLWAGSSGKIWIFGGWGYDSAGNRGVLNDLWNFNSATNEWTWVTGSDTFKSAGVYGSQGHGDPSNSPGARSGAITWVDTKGDLWLFGGNGYDSQGNQGNLNDLWKFDTSLNQWIWVSGADQISQPGSYGTQGIANASNIPSARSSSAAVESGGSVWIFGGTGMDANGKSGDLYDLWKVTP